MVENILKIKNKILQRRLGQLIDKVREYLGDYISFF